MAFGWSYCRLLVRIYLFLSFLRWQMELTPDLRLQSTFCPTPGQPCRPQEHADDFSRLLAMGQIDQMDQMDRNLHKNLLTLTVLVQNRRRSAILLFYGLATVLGIPQLADNFFVKIHGEEDDLFELPLGPAAYVSPDDNHMCALL